MKYFQYLKLNIAVGLFLAAFSSNVFADGKLSQDGKIAKIFTANKLKDGVYEPYTLLDRWQVTAAMIAQPSRLDTVGFGTVYDVKEINVDAAISAELYAGMMEGVMALAKPQADGKLVLDSAAGIKVPTNLAGLRCDFDIKSAENVQEECRKFLKIWLDSDESKSWVLMSADANFAGIKPMSKVVNWNAKQN